VCVCVCVCVVCVCRVCVCAFDLKARVSVSVYGRSTKKNMQHTLTYVRLKVVRDQLLKEKSSIRLARKQAIKQAESNKVHCYVECSIC